MKLGLVITPDCGFETKKNVFEYTIEAGSFIDFGAELRVDLEDLLEKADLAGYETVVRVEVSHRKRS